MGEIKKRILRYELENVMLNMEEGKLLLEIILSCYVKIF